MKCGHCKNTFDVKSLISHIRKYHEEKWNCGENGCCRVFSRGCDLSNHLKKNHLNDKIDISNLISNVDPILPNNNVTKPINVVKVNFDAATNSLKSVQTVNDSINTCVRTFLLELHSEPSLNRKQVTLISKKIAKLLFEPISNLIDSKNHSNEELVKGINKMKETLLSLGIEYNLKNDLINSEQYIQPKNMSIEHSVKPVQKHYRIQYNKHETKGAFVPMPLLFKYFFELPKVFNNTITNINNLKNENSISNFIQGDLWKSKISGYEKSQLVIPFHLYFDDWEPEVHIKN